MEQKETAVSGKNRIMIFGPKTDHERGWETARCRMAQATAPILDST